MILRFLSLILAFFTGVGVAYIFTLEEEKNRVDKKENLITTRNKTFVAYLYFTHIKKERLRATKRELPFSNSILKRIKTTLEAIKEGPLGEEKKYFLPTIPKDAKLRTVFLYNNCAYVDFSQDLILEHIGGSYAELQTIYSIVNTLVVTFPKYIDSVQLLIEGEKRNTLVGHISISSPLVKDLGV